MNKVTRYLTNILFSLIIGFGLLMFIEGACQFLFTNTGLTWVEEIAGMHDLNHAKNKNEKRIFVFGASSVIGYHHQGKSSLSAALGYGLRRSDPTNQWKVVNFGKAGEASEFSFDCARESLKYFPDVVVIYAGENEFGPIPVLRRNYGFQIERFLLKTKMARLVKNAKGHSAVVSAPDFRKSSWGEIVSEVERSREKIKHDFEKRIESFASQLDSRVKFVFVSPAINMAWGPSFHDDLDQLEFDLGDSATQSFIKALIAQVTGDCKRAIPLFDKALVSQPTFSDGHFRLAQCYRAIGDEKDAARHFFRAIDCDLLPRRTVPSLPATIIHIDALHHLMDKYKTSIIDFRFIEDDCHPTIETEFELAQAIVEKLRFGNSVTLGNTNEYFHEQGLNNEVLSKIYLSIGNYHNGRDSALPWLEKAKNLSSNTTEWDIEFKNFREKNRDRKQKLDATLEKLKHGLN